MTARKTMDVKLHDLDKNQTWTLVPPPFRIKTIGCHWFTN